MYMILTHPPPTKTDRNEFKEKWIFSHNSSTQLLQSYLDATSSGVSSISRTQLTESCFSTTPLTAGSGGESGEGDAAGEGGESGGGDADRPESPEDVRARIGVRSMYPPPANSDTTCK